MTFMRTHFQQGYITDLVCPPPPPGKTATQVLQIGLVLAREMCSSAKVMTTLNPYIADVSTISPADPAAVDIHSLAATFNVDVRADYATSDFTQYAITDKLPVLFGYSTTLVYHSALRTTRDGLEALTNPGNGVTIHGRWVVKVAERSEYVDEVSREAPMDDAFSLGSSSGVVNLLETQATRCNVMLSWYIRQSVDKSHRTTHKRFKELWRERMKERLYPDGA
ncbi:hypothetical protein EDD36DRAFT_304642 [Exophiala viscosa]|uniref:DUF7053 domain-containing protein n=1 Tax=Exophiala viscosa TaxID=2486360 RepID=A0AAN6DQJ2_9EURO|nr:hypothetical protein EDD36DRAFT_304642 [Exophiala viscosa]